MALHINLEKAKAMLAESIRLAGEDKKYIKLGDGRSCFYVHAKLDGVEVDPEDVCDMEDVELVPGCLVGDAFIREGIAMEWIVKNVNNEGAMELLRKLKKEGFITFTNHADMYLDIAQSKQDHGYTWGAAASRAERYIQANVDVPEMVV